ncbi:hypothetical protein ACP0HM_30320 [Escherichia coli]
MGKGERLWHFNVMVTHGDSFINPLYRIFPCYSANPQKLRNKSRTGCVR